MLVELCSELRERGISLGLAELHAEAREMLDRAGVIDCLGSGMVFDVLEDAYQAFEAGEGGLLLAGQDRAPPSAKLQEAK